MKLLKPVYLGYFVAVLFGFFAFFPLSPIKDIFAVVIAIATSNLLMIVAFNYDDTMSKFFKLSSKILYLPLIISLFMYGFCFFVYEVLLSFKGPIDLELYEVYTMSEAFDGLLILVFIIIVITEEIFWRGFAQQRLSMKYGNFTAITINAAIYSFAVLFSINPYLIGAALFSSFVLGFIFVKYKNLYIVILSHIIWDILILKIFPLV